MALAMALLKTVGSVVLIAGVAGIAMGLWGSARDVRSTQAVWDALLTQREPAPESYDPAMVADLPEIAQRYCANAMAPGTLLHRAARLEMEGSLILNGLEIRCTPTRSSPRRMASSGAPVPVRERSASPRRMDWANG